MIPGRDICTMVAVCALLTACGQASGSGESEQTSATPSATVSATDQASSADGLAAAAPDGSAIPDGTWAKTSTVADAQKLGLPKQAYRRILRADGVAHIELRIDGREFAQLGDDDGAMAVGDQGSAGYDADGNWVITSRSEGCFECVATFEWTLDGEELTLTLADAVTSEDPVEVLVSRLVMEGTYTRQ